MGLAEKLAEVGSAVSLQSFWQTRLGQLEKAHREGMDGVAVARAIAAAVAAVVLAAHRQALGRQTPNHALVAVGGFGRGEMAPHSDVDLLFLFARDRDKDPEFIAAVLAPLWDLRFEVGHSSRTVSEAVRFAREDLESCTAMMDGRLLAGDPEIFAQFHKALFDRLSGSALGKLQAWRRRRLESRDSVQLLEPHLKESPGGLRDLQALAWALKFKAKSPDIEALWQQYLDDQDLEILRQASLFLWRVRHELHFLTGRKWDLLEHELKPRIARRLGYQDQDGELAVEGFMRHYYLHAHKVHHLVELVFDRLTRRPRNRHRPLVLEQGALAVGGEILLPHASQYFGEDPVRLLRLFHFAQTRRLRLSEETQRAVRASLPLIDDSLRASAEAREVFLGILRGRCRVAQTLRAMHDLGALGAYLPEFGALTCLVQYDIYHLYTVDEHTLVAIDNLERLGRADCQSPLKAIFDQFARRDLLYLAVLLHDIGKSKRQNHIARGIEIARTLTERLGLPEEDRCFLIFQVEHHQEMVLLSQRRDLDDYRMIADFARLFPAREWLQALYLLSYADLSAVARDAWTEWRGALLWELYHKASEQLESGLKTLEQKQQGQFLLDTHLKEVRGQWPASKVAAFRQHVEQLPPRYLTAYERGEIEKHLELVGRLTPDRRFEVEFVARSSYTEVVVCTRDQRQLLAKICGVLAVNDVDIRRADVNTRDDGVVLDLFQVTDVDGSPTLPAWKQHRICSHLEEVIGLRLKARELLGRYTAHWERRKRQKKAGDRPPEVTIENQVSDRYTVIDVEVQDDVGLLYKITHCLAELGLDIHMAIVNTVASRARDAFYVVDSQGEKIVNYQVLQEIRQRLLETLGA